MVVQMRTCAPGRRTSWETLEPTNMGQGNQCLIACGGSKTVSVTVQTPPADCPCGGAGRVRVEIYSISADDTRRPAAAVAISADVLTADPACRIAVLISVGVYGTTAVSACRIARSVRVKTGTLGEQRKNGNREHQRCKNEARHRTPPLLLVRCDDADDDSTIFMLPPSPPESRLVPDFGPRSEQLARASTRQRGAHDP